LAVAVIGGVGVSFVGGCHCARRGDVAKFRFAAVTALLGWFAETSTTPADILQLRGRSGLFSDERLFVFAWRHIDIGFGLFRFWRWKRRIVTGKAWACAFDHAAIWFGCVSGW
jgi:hypothetical protein